MNLDRHRNLYMLITFCAMAASGIPARLALAQASPTVGGDYTALLGGALHLKLHVTAASGGAFSGTLDSPDQGAGGIPCTDFHLDGMTLTFRVPTVSGTWKGTVSGDGGTLSGTWEQGSPMPLNFTRDTFQPAEKPSPVDGIWLGAIRVNGHALRAQIRVKSDRAGHEFCTFDSLDQRALDWQCDSVACSGAQFSFNVPIVHGRWNGQLSADGKTLAGTWSQSAIDRPLDFNRQSSVTAPSKPAYDTPIPQVKAADLQSVLDRDLVDSRSMVFQIGPLAEGAGIAVGVITHGERRVFTFGAARPDSIFEIGSVTKTFTTLLLAQMVGQGKARFDEPVRELLPPQTVAKPAGAEITLLDLATQHSGLPRMPDNVMPAVLDNPYADYRPSDLYRFLARNGVSKPTSPEFVYSNLGVGLLGQALANRAGLSYTALLRREITAPLRLQDTVISLSPEQRGRFIQGHNGGFHTVRGWDFDALAPAGAIRSTAGDMLTFLEAQLHPEKAPTLAAAIAQTHNLRADALPGMRIGLAWLYVDPPGFYWHNGATGGFSSFVFFDPTNDCAAVVLYNKTTDEDGSFADRLGMHIRQRLAGKAAVWLGH